MKKNAIATNRNAIIRAREDRFGKFRTETANRDPGTTNFAATTSPITHATRLFIDLPEGSVSLTGAESRTLYRLLRKHYAFAGRAD